MPAGPSRPVPRCAVGLPLRFAHGEVCPAITTGAIDSPCRFPAAPRRMFSFFPFKDPHDADPSKFFAFDQSPDAMPAGIFSRHLDSSPQAELCMRLLHTSDWHLGRTLYGRKRYEEFEAFLNWLAETIRRNEIDALLVAGDVFDTGAPSHRAQELYYGFLCQVAASPCRHVAIVAGNHDSPSFLGAPKDLLKTLDMHVIGQAAENPEEEVLVCRDRQSNAELIICAVPYLRDRDMRAAEAGESVEDKERKLIEGIRGHYAAVGACAERKRRELGADIPIVGMGHLFATGGRTADGDGVRELYVGSLARISADAFPPCFDYLALGHLHIPQTVNGLETMRYSGSPLPMGFGEARQSKSVCRIDFAGSRPSVKPIEIPRFKKLERIEGNLAQIEKRISEAVAERSNAWLEVFYEGEEAIGDLRERLAPLVEGSGSEILRIRNNRIVEHALSPIREEVLSDLNAEEVFERCLAAHELPEAQREELRVAYRETLAALREADAQAE